MKTFPLPKPNKELLFTDIHFGKKLNSPIHNQDCLDFVKWVCQLVKDHNIDRISFLGDYYEHRNAINVDTMDYGITAAKLLNNLKIPIIFIIGNHDLYHRNIRTKFSTKKFEYLDNFVIVDEPLKIDNSLYMPFLFKEEYIKYSDEINNSKYVFGHFEFNDFILTGHSHKMTTGVDGNLFNTPKYIFSGHFHKRQIQKNIVYIGNTFPMDFSDSFDDKRGVCILNHNTEEISFIDWEECPRYYSHTISDIVDNKLEFDNKSFIRCVVDIDLPFTTIQELRQMYLDTYNVRDFSIEDKTVVFSDIETVNENINELSSIDEMIVESLLSLSTPDNINNTVLLKIFEDLQYEE